MPEAVDITKFDVEQVIAYFELDEINATLFREKGFNGAILYESMDSLSEHISHNLFMKITETIEVFRNTSTNAITTSSTHIQSTAPSTTNSSTSIPTTQEDPVASSSTAIVTQPPKNKNINKNHKNVLRRRDGSVRFPAKIAAGTRPVPKEKTTSIGKRTRAGSRTTGAPAQRKKMKCTSDNLYLPIKLDDDCINVENTADKSDPHDIGISFDGYCSVCGSGGRILETCFADNCRNAVCVGIDEDFNEDERKFICAWDVKSWHCPYHGGKGQLLKYNANISIDIQSLELNALFKQNIVRPAVITCFTSFMVQQIHFASEPFHDITTLDEAVTRIANRWRPKSKHWLLILTHCNNDGDLWFEDHNNGKGNAAQFHEFLANLQDNTANRDANIVFLVCGPILISQEAAINANIAKRFNYVLSALKQWTTGKILMFTVKDLQPRNVVPDIMKVIESHEIQSIPLPIAVRKYFQGRTDSSPVWVIINGNGYYIHSNMLPCRKHINAQKRSKRCTIIENWQVTVVNCTCSRMLSNEISEHIV